MSHYVEVEYNIVVFLIFWKKNLSVFPSFIYLPKTFLCVYGKIRIKFAVLSVFKCTI